MDMDFADGMRTAMRLVQAQKLMEATRVIQSTSVRHRAVRASDPTSATDRAIEGPIIDLTAEVIEPDVMTVPEGEANVPSGLSLPPSVAHWTRRMGEMAQTQGETGASTLQSRCADNRQGPQALSSSRTALSS